MSRFVKILIVVAAVYAVVLVYTFETPAVVSTNESTVNRAIDLPTKAVTQGPVAEPNSRSPEIENNNKVNEEWWRFCAIAEPEYVLWHSLELAGEYERANGGDTMPDDMLASIHEELRAEEEECYEECIAAGAANSCIRNGRVKSDGSCWCIIDKGPDIYHGVRPNDLRRPNWRLN